MITEAKGIKGKKTISGRWRYNGSSDSFTIGLDSIDPITGEYRTIVTYNDTPEGNDGKLIREE